MRLRWALSASRDLESIGTYISRDNPVAASRIMATIRDQIRLLAEHPHIGRPGRVPETRELIITNTSFIVPYRVRDNAVEILAIIHSSRQWPAEFI